MRIFWANYENINIIRIYWFEGILNKMLRKFWAILEENYRELQKDYIRRIIMLQNK